MKTNEAGNPIIEINGEVIVCYQLKLVAGAWEQQPGEARCAVSICSLAAETHAEATDALWDALRLECCSTGLNAQRIVMLHKHDIAAALKRLTPENHRIGHTEK